MAPRSAAQNNAHSCQHGTPSGQHAALYARCGYLLRYTSATVVTLPRGGGGGGMTGAFGGLHGLGGGEPTLLSASAPCGGDGGAPLACRSRSFQYCSLSGVGLPSRPTDCCCDDDPAPAGWCFLCLADHHAASAIGVQSKLYFPRCGGPRNQTREQSDHADARNPWSSTARGPERGARGALSSCTPSIPFQNLNRGQDTAQGSVFTFFGLN